MPHSHSGPAPASSRGLPIALRQPGIDCVAVTHAGISSDVGEPIDPIDHERHSLGSIRERGMLQAPGPGGDGRLGPWWESRLRRRGREWRDQVNWLSVTHPIRLYPHGPQVIYGATATAMSLRLFDHDYLATCISGVAAVFALTMLATNTIWDRAQRGPLKSMLRNGPILGQLGRPRPRFATEVPSVSAQAPAGG